MDPPLPKLPSGPDLVKSAHRLLVLLHAADCWPNVRPFPALFALLAC